jgi:hypothetical protein
VTVTLAAIGDTWELDGFTFNAGPDARGYSALASAKGWDSGLPARPRLSDRPNGNGSYRASNYRGPRVVELAGVAQAPSKLEREALMNDLAALCLDPATLYPLTKTTRAHTLTAYVELTGDVAVTPLPDGLTVEFNIQVVAADGRKYSTEVQSAQAMLAQAGVQGVQWDGPGPSVTGIQWGGPGPAITGVVWQASSGTGSTIGLTNAGTAAAPILFTITAPAAATLITPAITRLDTGETIAYAGTMGAGSVLTVNTGTGLALLDGVPVRGLFSRFEPFEIPPRSDTSVQFSAGGPADTATLLAQWSNAYN